MCSISNGNVFKFGHCLGTGSIESIFRVDDACDMFMVEV